MPRYAEIILPLAQPAYTFAVPESAAIVAGQAVVVQFGPRRFYTGIVRQLHDRRPDVRRVKTIGPALYDRPLVSAEQLALWEWIASYYMCTIGEVMRAALPSLIKPSADSAERFAEEEFRPRTECYFRLDASLHAEEPLREALDRLERRAPKQYAALLEIAAPEEGDGIRTGEVARRLLAADRATLHALERKGYVRSEEHERSAEHGTARFRLPQLSACQQEALDALRSQYAAGKRTALLAGVTGSGKTELYIHLAAETLARGGDVLLLVPEIALTAQLIERMERIFGSRVTAYHSKLSDRLRSETYLRLCRSEGGEFVVGVRSSIFLPLRHLQLIIVDEEHDAGYKQSDPAPRYNARDCAVVAAQIFGGRTLLGSATPSLESWHNALKGKYALAQLGERYGAAQPPTIFISDTLRAVKRGERRTHFNKSLADRIADRLARGEQTILFQNRRGFAPYVACEACGWTARCPGCNVALTYHKSRQQLVCHYCGHTEHAPQCCPDCHAEVRPMGFGTEKVEEALAALFPEARIARLDRDAVTSERAFRAIVSDFAERRTDILVGTQMVTKGFDFEGVSLVGILNADNLLLSPDFRASERAFQLMTQVAGRAGRRSSGGEVVIQTSEPDHPVIRQVASGDYAAMARRELAERERFGYPPFARITRITLRHRDPELLHRAAETLAGRLRGRFGRRLLGPTPPPVDRIRDEYLTAMLLKVEPGASPTRARELLGEELRRMAADPETKTVTVVVDVDPQ